VLQEVAGRIRGSVRSADLACRTGGEEFVVVLPGLGREQAAAFGERLRRVFEQADWGAKPLTISLGAATYQFESGRTGLKRIMKQMIAEADQAMYRSKHTGRNRFVHFGELPQTARSLRETGGSRQHGEGAI
jgi:diguanylate cyclase (GGDEF)-like protein